MPAASLLVLPRGAASEGDHAQDSTFPQPSRRFRSVTSNGMSTSETEETRRRRGWRAGEGAAAGKTIRIVLADDHAVVRSGLRMLLDSERDFEVVAEAGDVEAARRYVRGHHPDGARARPQHARRLEPGGDPRDPRRSPGHADRGADDAAGARVRARGARRRRARLRAQGGRRRRARGGGAPRRCGRELPEPEARRAASPPSRRPARRTISPSARSTCCA